MEHEHVLTAELNSFPASIARRELLVGTVAAAIAAALGSLLTNDVVAQDGEMVDEVVIDLEVEPPSLDPALGNDLNAWSLVHALHDSLVDIGPDGKAQPLLAESIDFPDPLMCRVVLRAGRRFHDGSPVTSESVNVALEHMRKPEVASQIAENFDVIETVTLVDDLTVEFGLSSPAPYLLAQFAPWLTPFPATAEPTIGHSPVGAGPYRFVSWTPGESVTVEADPAYPADSPKGRAIAKRAVFRFVPDPTTRVADLLSGTATIIRSVPTDQANAVEAGGATVITQPVTGIAFIRMVNDVEPFTDPRVRQALNHAVDVQTLIDTLLNGNGQRLASLFPEGGLGYDPALAPMAYDPELARSLLADAGYPDGFDVGFEYTTATRLDIVEAIAGMLGEVDVRVELRPLEQATFNQTWKESAPLRYVSWRPLNDPYTLLNLMINANGFLSSFSSDTLQPMIEAAAVETDADSRAALYRQLGAALQQDPPAIYLHSLVALYGVAADAPAWTSRPDDYTIPTYVGA
jgi:peptide/nickel transport system substrate-binding protein